MNHFQITLAAEERDYLAEVLQAVLKDKRVEEHRTRTPTYRQGILHEEDLIRVLLEKLGIPAA